MTQRTWRHNLPRWDSLALPRAESDERNCRATNCPDTNWGGEDRLHLRGSSCPPLEKAVPLSQDLIDAAVARYEKQHEEVLDRLRANE